MALSPLRAVLFDLDGTLVDTAPDLAYAVNVVRAERERDPLPLARIRPYVSHGSFALTRIGFDLTDDHPGFEDTRRRLLEVYSENLTRESRLFADMETVIETLEARGMRWGVVTNKPGWLTEPLMNGLGLSARAGCVVSGDTLPRRKPHPDPLLHAAGLVGAAAQACVYVGDAERDVQAGHAALMATLIAAFGYIEPDVDPAAWGADGVVDSPLAILDWLDREQQRRATA